MMNLAGSETTSIALPSWKDILHIEMKSSWFSWLDIMVLLNEITLFDLSRCAVVLFILSDFKWNSVKCICNVMTGTGCNIS